MSLYRKTLLIIAIVTLALLAAMYAVTRTVLMESYVRLEQKHLIEDVERVRHALANYVSSLNSMLSDWATWDDSYAFMEDQNPRYVDSNLVDSAFTGMRLNALAYLDTNGKIVWGQGYDLEQERAAPLPAGLADHLSARAPLGQPGSTGRSTQGLLVLPNGPLLVVAAPILRSDGSGPPRGTLVMARSLNSAEVSALATTTARDVILQPSEEPLPSDFAAARSALASRKVAFRPLDDHLVSAYAFLEDLYGQPSLIVRVTATRGFYNQGRSTMLYTLGGLLAAALVLAVAMLLLVDRVMLSRLLRLSADVKAIRGSSDTSARVRVAGRDELGALGDEINSLLEALETSQKELSEQYEEARTLADRDSVTGLLNHRAFFRRMEEEIVRSQRTNEQWSLLIIDLDNFKFFNDLYGHPVGDDVLREVGDLLRRHARGYDAFARHGGDEFSGILPHTGKEGAVAFAERVRASLGEKPYPVGDGESVPIYLSFGIATYPEDGRDINTLIATADTNLYSSKQLGGDSITFEELLGEEQNPKAGGFGILEGLVTAVDNKDHYTRRHSEDVTSYALALGRELGLEDEECRTLRIAGLLHDVGKIGVPDYILRKPGSLDAEEYAILKQHALLGELIVKELPNIHAVQTAISAHHERFDGAGYPRGLAETEIPLLGRILAVADAYSAMTTNRPYRKAMTPEQAEAELRKVAGTQLDPELVRIFLRAGVSAKRASQPAGGTRAPVGVKREQPMVSGG